jgi:hypothetical protein
MTTKKKLGRPPLPKGEARTELLQVRLTKGEHKSITEQAKTKGVELSEWVRTAILTGER